jgi:hypothetical protein
MLLTAVVLKNISKSSYDVQGDFEICADILTSGRTPQ